MRRRVKVVIGGAAVALLAIVIVAVAAFPGHVVTRADSRPVELPGELANVVFDLCIPGLGPSVFEDGRAIAYSITGSGSRLKVQIESVGDWSVSVDRTGASLQNESSDADDTRMTSFASNVIPSAESLYNCIVPYRFAPVTTPPSSSSQLLQLYRYDTTVLWPCMASHGIKLGDPPTRAQFANSFTALTVEPFAAMAPSRKSLPRLVKALEACPLRPAYLG
ncbi:MAG TPA: hypothetical protein VGM38_04340 [Pseudolysinimonas sp.]|jgi:hypothetical protein